MTSRSLREAPRMGKKAIYLPNFTLTLLNNKNLPPHFASFLVPLNLNKLDLRDYLWNCYGISVKNVRSYIQMQKVQHDKTNAKKITPRRWFRPRSIKKMMVEMYKPFVWPKAPEDFEQWDKTYEEGRRKAQKKAQDTQQLPGGGPAPDRKTIAEQAKELLKGKKAWNRDDTLWKDSKAWIETEKDFKV